MARDRSLLAFALFAAAAVSLAAQSAAPPVTVAKPGTPQTQLPGRGRANQPPPPPLTYTGLIVGRVIDSVSGKPIAGAVVALGGGPSRVVAPAPPVPGQVPLPALPPPRMLTDEEGRFAFRNLARGNYTLSSTKIGFAAGVYGRSRPEGSGRPVQLDDGERMSDVNIRMLKFAAIEGRVTDEAGEPIVGATVRTFRRQLSSGRRVLTMGPNVPTDDRGVYRFFNLMPGEYLVSVPMSSASAPIANVTPEGRQNFSATTQMMLNGGPPLGAGGMVLNQDARFAFMGMTASPALVPDGSGRWRGYTTTFYPTGSTSSTAEQIVVASGEERTGVDITMRYVPTSSISGIVTSPLGQAANYALRLLPADASDWSSEPEVAVTATDSGGQFMFLAVPAGQYVIQSVRVPREINQFAMVVPVGRVGGAPAPAQLPPEPLLWGLTPVTVGDGDVAGIGVVMREGLTISGRVEFTGSKPRPDGQRLTQIPIAVESANGRDNLPSSGPSSRVTADGKFVTAAKLPGKYFLRVGGSPSGFIVQSITANGVDATDVPIDLTSNVTSVVITFTDLISDVRGTVRGVPPGSDPPGVVLFPADSTAWKDFGINPLRMKLTRASATGSYVFSSLVSGDYYAVAIRDEFSNEWNDAAFLEVLSRTAQRFTLGLGEHRTLDLQLSDARPPGIGRAPVSHPALESGLSLTDVVAGLQPGGDDPRDHGPAVLDAQTPQVRDARPPSDAVGTGSISGRVMLDDGTMRPARLARVSVSGGPLINERQVLTDDEGRFTVAWLPPGSYQLMAAKAAYLSMFYGGKRAGTGPGTPIKVEARQTVTGIDLAMPKGAVIAGMVLDPMGQPAASVRIQVQTFTRRDGERLLTSASVTGPSTTDDRGSYRLYGLRPGTYVVSAVPANPAPSSEIRQLSEQEMRAALTDAARGTKPPALADPPRSILPAPTAIIPVPEPGGRSVGFSPVFYPGALREQDAAEIVLTAGQELTGVNIQLLMLPVARLEGRVFGVPAGQPGAQPQLSLQRIDGSTSVSSQGVRYQDGSFQAVSVPAGHYILTAAMEQPQPRPPVTPGVPTPPPAPPTVFWAQQEFDVAGADLLNLVLTLGPPMTLSGRVIFDGTTKPDPKTVSVRLETVGLPAPIRAAPPAQLDATGAFTVTGILPGRYRLSATSTAPSAGATAGPIWSVLSSTVEGQDSLIVPFDYRNGRQITNAVVTMTDQPAEVSGKLIDAAGLPVPGMTIVLFAADPAMWTMNSTRVNRRTSSSAEGDFRFTATLPGQYYMAVLNDLDANDWADPAFKEQLASQSMKLTVAKGEKKAQTLRVK